LASAHFRWIAEAVCSKVAESLCAETGVIDSRGVMISHSRPRLNGSSSDVQQEVPAQEFLRVPLQLDNQLGEMILSRPANGEEISPRLARAFIELLISQVVLAERHPAQRELKNKFLHDLLHGLISDEAAILREAKVLGMDLAPPRAVILIDATEYIFTSSNAEARSTDDAQVRRRAQFVIGSVVSFFHLPNDTICAYIGDGEIAVLKASDTRNLVAWVEREDQLEQSNSSWSNLVALKRAGEALRIQLQSDTRAPISIGIGRHHPGVRGLAQSYGDARAALSLGRRFHHNDQVYCLDELGMAAFVGISDEQTKFDLATYLLSPLDYEPDLLKTLEVFFAENCCPSATAKRLSVHRNTLSYRLDKITSLTGLDPRHFDEAVQIRLSLLLRSSKTG
jgi:carbohydrate diacid regulator